MLDILIRNATLHGGQVGIDIACAGGKMNLDGYGLAVGCDADLAVLQAADPIEAIRLLARRLAVIRRGRVIAETPAEIGALFLEGRAAALARRAMRQSPAKSKSTDRQSAQRLDRKERRLRRRLADNPHLRSRS